MEFADKELIADFVVESQEGLANVEQQMLAIEAAGADLDAEVVNAVFRTMHSIKGSAGFLGLDRIETLAHSLEEVLNYLRNREIIPTSELVTTVLRAADFITGLIGAVETSQDADVSPYVADLSRFRPGACAESAPPVHSPTQAPSEANEPEESDPVRTALSDAAREFLVECYDNLEETERQLLDFETEPSDQLLRDAFRTMHTIKQGSAFLELRALERHAEAAEQVLGVLRDEGIGLTADMVALLLSAIDKCREGLHLVERSGSDAGFEAAEAHEQLMKRLASLRNTPGDTNEPETPSGPDSMKPSRSDSKATPEQPAPVASKRLAPHLAGESGQRAADDGGPEKPLPSLGESTIRVDVALLDKLMTRVGELVLARNQILQYTTDLEDSTFVSTAQRLNLITTELQEGVMKTRMQPIGNVWSKFPRVVRDLASQLGKQVLIEMEGKETELDKTIIEAIKDPLTHLVRNAVDHGIETPEIRQRAGKAAEGRLLLRAFHEGGQVNIEIRDDGVGLNIDRIRKKAVERGLVGADQAARMSDREIVQLVLLPGFSTAEKVTSVSGRGVGMDVVKTNIERIGGMIDLQSREGQGTTVKIKIPLTLAIIPALVVTNDGERYAIPQASLLELVRLEGEQAEAGIEFVHGAPVYRLRGKLLPLVNLSQRLGLDEKPVLARSADRRAGDGVVNIVVLRANDRQFGLVVDKVNDTEEIVVKPLSRQLKSISEYAGATIMGDGTVALILDVMGLAIAAGLAGEIREQTIAGTGAAEHRSSQEIHSLLVVDLGDARRYAMPTSMVSRLEKVPCSSIEFADGREVIQYRGAIMPLVRLAQVFGTPARHNEPEELQIVVYAEEDESYGLVVNRIVDAVETELHLQSPRQDTDNLLGTTVIQDRVTDVLNLRNLARHAAGARNSFGLGVEHE